jgi:uncharacterized membrane protein HdeD (DUF308 family)
MNTKWKDISLYLPGVILIILGILVVAFPMLLVALISAGLILIGIAAITMANQLRQLNRRSYWTVDWEPVDRSGSDWLDRMFVHRRW